MSFFFPIRQALNNQFKPGWSALRETKKKKEINKHWKAIIKKAEI